MWWLGLSNDILRETGTPTFYHDGAYLQSLQGRIFESSLICTVDNKEQLFRKEAVEWITIINY